MYHSVSSGTEPRVHPYYRLATSPLRFRQHMLWVKQAGYKVVSLEDIAKHLSAPAQPSERLVAITFDDGFRNFLTEAWPILDSYGFPVTVFLATGFVSHSRQTFKSQECLTWSEVRWLRDAGVSFGAHTVTHPVLYGLEWSRVRQEIADSRRQIEDALTARVGAFSYPYAFPGEDVSFRVRLVNELLSQGFTSMVTTTIGRAGANTSLLCLPRLPINGADDRALLLAKLEGAYDWMGAVQACSRSIGAWFRTRPDPSAQC